MMNDEPEKDLEGKGHSLNKELSHHLPWGTDENHGNLSG
jgi:hypothetical protein